MLNAEKYKYDILRKKEKNEKSFDSIENTHPFVCAVCNVSGNLGYEGAIKWLLSEYEPPLLENGDGLKTGDWIMVKNDGLEWRKLQFLFFWDGYFLTTDGVSTPDTSCVVRWDYARLPDEGE